MKYINDIKTKLAALGKNQSWLAEQCGIDKSQLAKVLSGKQKPSVSTLDKIGEVLELELRMINK